MDASVAWLLKPCVFAPMAWLPFPRLTDKCVRLAGCLSAAQRFHLSLTWLFSVLNPVMNSTKSKRYVRSYRRWETTCILHTGLGKWILRPGTQASSSSELNRHTSVHTHKHTHTYRYTTFPVPKSSLSLLLINCSQAQDSFRLNIGQFSLNMYRMTRFFGVFVFENIYLFVQVKFARL